MSDWQVGDLALCVHDTFVGAVKGSIPQAHPAKGAVYRVVGMRDRFSISFLVFDDFTDKGWNHDAFRKIIPDKHEECEPEFVTLLKRIKIGVAA